MNQKPQDTDSSMTFHLTGQLSSSDFPAWMTRQATKLGVVFDVTNKTAHNMDVSASGAHEMVEAFALACSLGPKSVCIEMLEMDDVTND